MHFDAQAWLKTPGRKPPGSAGGNFWKGDGQKLLSGISVPEGDLRDLKWRRNDGTQG